MSPVATIARREVKTLFDQPTGYVLLVAFVAINAFLFFRNVYLSNVASLRPMLEFLPWIFLLFVPAVTMRSFAEDNRSGILEVVLAQPISEASLVLGKFLGTLAILGIALFSTLFIPIGLRLSSGLHLGPVVAQYLGAGLLAAGFAAIGVWASSLTMNQVTAFIIAVTLMFVLILLGLDPLIVGLPQSLGAIAARISVLPHFDGIARGVIDFRDVGYFVSLVAIFLTLSYAVVLRRRLASKGPAALRLRLLTTALVAAAIALDLVGDGIRGRLDLTPGRQYTLAKATTELGRSLKDVVTIQVFSSKDLPTEFALQRRDVIDLLRDLSAAAGPKIRVVMRDPTASDTARMESRRLGILPIQFNVFGRSELQVKEGYLGLAIQYDDKYQTIPFIRQTNDLEYRIASSVRSLSRAGEPRIAFVTDQAAGQFEILEGELDRAYSVQRIELGHSGGSLDPNVEAVIVASQEEAPDTILMGQLRGYLADGGKLMVMASGMAIYPEAPVAFGRTLWVNDLLKTFGVRIRSDLVYDLKANQTVRVATEVGSILRPYPYFVRARSTHAAPINAELDDVLLGWASSIDTGAVQTGSVTPLLVTTEAGGIAEPPASIEANQAFSEVDLATRLVAVQVTPTASSGKSAGRMVVIGNSMMSSDEFIQRSPPNGMLALNAVDWLVQDESLIRIRAKNRQPPPLVFASEVERNAVKYFNLAGMPALITLYGAVRLVRRRRLARLA